MKNKAGMPLPVSVSGLTPALQRDQLQIQYRKRLTTFLEMSLKKYVYNFVNMSCK
jgi:hypothetical protein